MPHFLRSVPWQAWIRRRCWTTSRLWMVWRVSWRKWLWPPMLWDTTLMSKVRWMRWSQDLWQTCLTINLPCKSLLSCKGGGGGGRRSNGTNYEWVRVGNLIMSGSNKWRSKWFWALHLDVLKQRAWLYLTWSWCITSVAQPMRGTCYLILLRYRLGIGQFNKALSFFCLW